MSVCSLIRYKGKAILYFDYRGLRADLVANMKEANQMIRDYPGPEVLSLADFSNTFGTPEAIAYLTSADVRAVQKKVKKQAVLGITGAKKTLLDIFNSATGNRTRNFETEEEAKEWLIKL